MMRGGLVSLILRPVKCLILCFTVLIGSASAQDFLSIACCADFNFTDTTTSINWITDDIWFPDRTSCKNIINKNFIPNHGRARVFNIALGKRCYNLRTIKSQEHLIRGSFAFGDSLRSQSGNISFNVLVGVTPIGRVSSSNDLKVEAVFRANSDSIDFCLVHEEGNPYISSLELTPLHDLKYIKDESPTVLKLIARIDLGGSGKSLRYPDDKFDRIWEPIKSDESPTVNANISINNANTTVPPRVLQTAVTHRDRLEFLQSGLDEGAHSNYSVILYFVELNDSVKTGQRVFDIYINDEKKQVDFDILANGANYREVGFYVRANGSVNVTLNKVPNGFEFGPICSAYEIFKVQSWIQLTDQNDVNVIGQVKEELLEDNKGNVVLESWSGDPCIPDPWEGLLCHLGGDSSVIIGLNLSSRQLTGSLPHNITRLAYLEYLNLSNNDFSGGIPEFPTSSMLVSMDLSHNDLTGSIPESLASLPSLKTLYYGCNPWLEKELPPSFNSLGLTTDKGECDSPESTNLTHRIVIGSVACGSFLVTVAVGVMFVCFYRHRFAQSRFDGKPHLITENLVFSLPSTDDVIMKSISIQVFTLQSIEIATQKYKTLIGEGGFGPVFRGTLPDGEEVAVKVRSATSTQGTKEFENELNLLSAIQHQNLVPLLGYCCENDQQILVYPFMSNGSLQDRLYGEASKRKTLDWATRLFIALGSARGLEYLHTFAGRCVIHRDVKSSNILLDHSMCAKVADFGFSKYATQEGDCGVSLEVRGTAGYLDPEYYSTQHLSAKSDVFSFGVVLLEIISGREPLDVHRPRNEWSLVEWAKPYIRESKIDEIVDPNIKGGYHAEALWRVVEVALACIQPFSAYRPCMADIVRELEDALIIENNASEYMKSIDSIGGYSLGGSYRYSIPNNMDKKIVLPLTPSTSEPSPVNLQALSPLEPR